VRLDFAHGAVASVGGWVLSLMEVRVYALVALKFRNGVIIVGECAGGRQLPVAVHSTGYRVSNGTNHLTPGPFGFLAILYCSSFIATPVELSGSSPFPRCRGPNPIWCLGHAGR
jgi:hypothetical protein